MTIYCEEQGCLKPADILVDNIYFCMEHYERYFQKSKGMVEFEFVVQKEGKKVE